jgi:hypothetical protein
MKIHLAICTLVLSGAIHSYGQRAAFLIGIGNYQHMGKLTNCSNDADSMKEVFYSFGYDTFEIKNASDEEVRAALDKWFPLMSKYHDVVIYFSGHGFMLASTNVFLALNDFDPKNYDKVEERTIHKFYLMQRLAILNTSPKAFPVNKMIIIDACREFPDIDIIKKEVKALTFKEPFLLQYAIYYTTQAGGVSLGDGVHNSVATAALLDQLPKRGYEDQNMFFNDVNGLLMEDPKNTIQFRPDGLPLTWSFVEPGTPPCKGCAPDVVIPNTHICRNCEPNHISELKEFLGSDLNAMRLLDNDLKRVDIATGSGECYSAELLRSPVRDRLFSFLNRFNVPIGLLDVNGSFLVYEFINNKLSTIQVYLKYQDRIFHNLLANALNVNLKDFPGIAFLASSDAYAVVLGRLYQYGYSIVEIGPSSKLINDSWKLDKFSRVFSTLEKQKLERFR